MSEIEILRQSRIREVGGRVLCFREPMEPQAKTAEREWSGVLTYRLQRRDWVIIGWNFLMIGLFDWGKIQRPVLALVAPILLFLTLLATGDLAKSKRGHLLWLVVAVSIAWYLVAQHFWH